MFDTDGPERRMDHKWPVYPRQGNIVGQGCHITARDYTAEARSLISKYLIDLLHHVRSKDMSKYINFIKELPLELSRSLVYRIPIVKKHIWRKYPKYKFLQCTIKNRLHILKPELFVQWLTTYQCNFHCLHCEATAGERAPNELTTDEAHQLISDLHKMGVKRVFLSGGEPLLRKDLFVIIRHILDSGMAYGIASNSFLVSRFTKEFREMKPMTYFTSIDGLEKTNDAIRGQPGAFEKTLEALEFFKSIGVEDRIINTVVLPHNLQDLPELLTIIQGSGATLWRLALPIPVGRGQGNEAMNLSEVQIRSLLEFVETSRKTFNVELSEDAGYLGCKALTARSTPFFCGAGLTRCSIMPDGEVLGCQIAYDSRFSEGNIRQLAIHEIWKNGFSRFRAPEFSQECQKCEHFDCCRGGCWGMRLKDRHCLKEIWEGMNDK